MKFRALILAIFLSISAANSESSITAVQQQATPPVTQAQNVAFETCTKMFAVNKEKLYYLTLGAVTANKFVLEEMQTENGYVIFSVSNKKYLATIAGIDAQNSILKITPCNDIYFFPPGIVINMFKYIDINLNTAIE